MVSSLWILNLGKMCMWSSSFGISVGCYELKTKVLWITEWSEVTFF